MNCPICDSSDNKFRFVKNGYDILQCQNCRNLFTDFNPTTEEIESIYSDSYFQDGGYGYNDYTLEKDLLIKRGEYYASKLQKYTSIGNVLDIGAAAGFILKGFENKGWKGIGIDPNRTMVEYGKDKLNLTIIHGTLDTVNLEHQFDLIILIQVIAHINSVRESIEKMSKYLNSNGQILIETWDKDSLISKISGRNWHEYSPPSTLNYFSKKTLSYLMNQHGFHLIDIGTPQKKINSSHAKSLLKHKFNESSGLKHFKWMLSLIPNNINLLYPAEDLFWALYKKD